MNELEKLVESNYSSAMSYDEYRQKIADLHSDNKTTGINQSDVLLEYSKLNEHRMKRIEKTIKLLPEAKSFLSDLEEKVTWLVITEAWCGDAAQSVPVLHALAEQSEKVELKIILRDEHQEIMELFLTNGSKSIPKLVCLDKSGKELFTWGPRPAELQKMVVEYKQRPEPKEPYEEFVIKLQKWYARDKTESVQKEIIERMKETLITA